ncbi:MAG: hypothetical protein ACTIJ6_06255 [Leucobacter sp.]
MSGHQTIAASVRHPIAGTLLEYRGSFMYHFGRE